jgi:hypothetical protein
LPLFDPIEFLFGFIKRSFQRHYCESSGSELFPYVVETFRRFERYEMRAVFQHCGWKIQGVFDPTAPMAHTAQHIPDVIQAEAERDAVAATEYEVVDDSCLDEA